MQNTPKYVKVQLSHDTPCWVSREGTGSLNHGYHLLSTSNYGRSNVGDAHLFRVLFGD